MNINYFMKKIMSLQCWKYSSFSQSTGNAKYTTDSENFDFTSGILSTDGTRIHYQ